MRVQTTRRPASRARCGPAGASLRRARRRAEHTERGGFRAASLSFWVGYPRESPYGPTDPAGSSGRGPARDRPGSASRPAGSTTNTQGSNSLATEVGIRELLEAGVHFGHQTRRWNPKMRRFIFGERGGIHIIDLQKTERLLHTAQEFAGDLAGRGGTILFVGTKKQARDTDQGGRRRAAACPTWTSAGWAGCSPTSRPSQAHQAPARAARLDRGRHDGPAAGRASASPRCNERDKLETNLGGVARHAAPARRDVRGGPEDRGDRRARGRSASRSRSSGWWTRTATRTRCDYVIPGNDDAIRSCKVIIDGDRRRGGRARGPLPCRGGGRPARARGAGAHARPRSSAQREAEEQERREAEERARREAEEAGFSPRRARHPERHPARGSAGAGAPRERRTFDPDEES